MRGALGLSPSNPCVRGAALGSARSSGGSWRRRNNLFNVSRCRNRSAPSVRHASGDMWLARGFESGKTAHLLFPCCRCFEGTMGWKYLPHHQKICLRSEAAYLRFPEGLSCLWTRAPAPPPAACLVLGRSPPVLGMGGLGYHGNLRPLHPAARASQSQQA